MSKTSRYWFRLVSTFFERFKFIFLIGIGIGFFVFAALHFILPNLPRNVQKIGVIGEFTPDSLPDDIAGLVSDGLTTLDVSGKANPGIAQSWDVSSDGKTWTFHLNKNLYWQDGSNVTSSDINYDFSDANVSKPDSYTIVFALKTGLASLPVTLSKPVFKHGLLGVGQWKVSNLTLAGNYIDTLTLVDKNNDQKIFYFFPDETHAKIAYEAGQVNKVDGMIDAKPFDNWKEASVSVQIDKQKYVAVFLNTTDDLLADKNLRQALDYAIDKSSFGDNRAIGPISPNSWAYNPSLKTYDYNPSHASDLINQSTNLSSDQKKNLKITLSTSPDLLSIAQNIANYWDKIGVMTTIQVTPVVPDNYQAYLAIYDIPLDPDQYFTWHSTQTQTNITHLKDPRIDKLLEDGRLETDSEKRKQTYFDFQKFLVEDSPAIFLYYPSYFDVVRK